MNFSHVNNDWILKCYGSCSDVKILKSPHSAVYCSNGIEKKEEFCFINYCKFGAGSDFVLITKGREDLQKSKGFGLTIVCLTQEPSIRPGDVLSNRMGKMQEDPLLKSQLFSSDIEKNIYNKTIRSHRAR